MNEIFDLSELDAFAKDLLELSERKAPKLVKKFMKKEGGKLRKETQKKARAKVKKRTGNYYKGIKSGRVYKYSGNGGTAIRVYSGRPAYHAHLLEYGHRLIVGGEEVGFVKGKNVFGEARDEFSSTFRNDIEAFLDKVVKEI